MVCDGRSEVHGVGHHVVLGHLSVEAQHVGDLLALGHGLAELVVEAASLNGGQIILIGLLQELVFV